MKSLIMLIVVLVFCNNISAKDFIVADDETVICNLFGHPKFGHVKTYTAVRYKAKKAMEWISSTVGIKPNFTLLAGEFSRKVGAFAVIHEGERYIVYDKKLIFTGNKNRVSWKSLGLLSHELTHHTSGVTSGIKISQHDGELEADRGAGHILRMLGATLEQALSWTDILSKKSSKSHPGRADRRDAVIEGWKNADALF